MDLGKFFVLIKRKRCGWENFFRFLLRKMRVKSPMSSRRQMVCLTTFHKEDKVCV